MPVLAEVGQAQRLLHPAAVGVRIGAHAPIAGRSQLAELLHKPAVPVEEFFRASASASSSPECEAVRGPSSRWAAAPGGRARSLPAGGPRLRQARSSPWASAARSSASAAVRSPPACAPPAGCPESRQHAVLHRRRHRLVHAVVVGTLDEVRRPAVAAQQALQFFMRNTRQQASGC